MPSMKDIRNWAESWVKDVRSQADLKGYSDPVMTYVDKMTGEVKEGYPPSIVDSSAYEPLPVLIARLTRGEEVSSRNVHYAYEADVDPQKPIDEFDPTRREGFDMADAPSLVRDAKLIYERWQADVAKQKADEKALKEKEDAEASKKASDAAGEPAALSPTGAGGK